MKSVVLKMLFLVLFIGGLQTIQSQNINNPNKPGPLGTNVNTYSGNLHIPRNDIDVQARGFDINVSFYYNSFNFDRNDGYGNGWGLSYGIKYTTDTANGKTIIWGDGREDTYLALPGGGYQAPTGFFNTLSQYQPNKFLLTELDGTRYYFDDNIIKRITKIADRDGNYISFNYTDTLLTSIVTKSGQTISFNYTAGKLTSVVDAIASPSRTCTYTYDGAGNLMQVTDPLGGTMKYSYLINGPMKTLADKNNNTVDIIYYPDFTVSELIGCNKRQSFSYDTLNNVSVATDYMATGGNQATTYQFKQYNGISWLSSLTSNCCGFNMLFDFDANGNKTKQTDANGNITTYTYDNRGNVLSITDALNQTALYTYSTDFNNITSYTDPKGNKTVLEYNSTGDLVKLTEPGNQVYSATYNSNGDMTGSTDPKGNTYTYGYDSNGNLTSATGPNGFTASLTCDARGNFLSYTDSRANQVSMEYDILDRLKKVTDPLNKNMQLTYDAEGNAIAITDQTNAVLHLKYDASDRIVQITDPLNNKSSFGYDAMDNVTNMTNALGNAQTAAYDARNRLSSIKDALGNTTTLSYDANGNVVSATLANSERFTYTYDALNRVKTKSDANGIIASVEYDKNSNVISYTDGTGAKSTAEYDSLNRIRKITDPLGYATVYTYDNNNNLLTITDRNGLTKTFTYDGMNRVKTYTDRNGGIVTVNYDTEGNQTSIKDQDNNITSYTYDNLNRVKVITYPDGKTMQFTYDSKGNIVTKILADGTNINFVYDTLNRIISKTLPNGNVYTYTYDPLGRVTTAANSAGTVAITYDELNRITSESFDGRITRYSYDIAGRTQTTIYPDSTTVTRTYDTRNRLLNITKGSSPVVSYQYNNANAVINKTFANGVSTNLQYDFANRLNSVSTASGAIQNTSYAYDKEMNIQSINKQNAPDESEQFSYDNNYRITNYKRGVIGGSPVIQNTYSFDALGNRTGANLNGTNTTYTINNLNQLANSNNGSQNINFTYDNNGNLTYDGHFYKTYDAEGKLLKDSSAPSNVITYLYDAIGRRVQKTYNGIPLKYTYAGLAQIEERDGITGDIRTRTIFRNFLDPVLNEKNNNSYYYHQNELNSVEAITNGSGNVVEKYKYDLYGKQTVYDGSNNVIPYSTTGNRFGFTGQEYDSASGSNHFQMRDYSPETGTFGQRDPIGYADGMGMYQYVHDNPANGIDILGLDDDCGGHATSEQKTWTYYTDETQFYSGMFSNFGSYVQVYQSSTTKTMTVQRVVCQFMGSNATVPISVLDHGILAKASTFANSTPLSVAMVPFNIANTVTPAIDMYYNGSEMSAGQIFDNTTNMVSGGATTGVGLYGLSGGSLTATGLASAPVAFGAVALAGGLAIEGTANWAYQKATGMSFSDVGAQTDIPFFTSAVSWMYSGPMFESSAFGNESVERTTDNMSWTTSSKYKDARKKTNKVAHTHTGTVIGWKPRIIDCPQNGKPGGPRTRRYWFFKPNGDSIEVITSRDPNEIIGPDGQPSKKWVSVKDRLPYTILFENDKSATAPAKFVRVTTPIEPKQDATTFQLSTFGFNNQTFSIPAGTASIYQRLDCRDSLGLYVDLTAGYDQVNNKAFWDFQCIDPVTLLPPSDPLKGFLLKQDSTHPNFGHAFVNFSIKPVTTAVTLDTIGARASIIFDSNDTIPTNIATNTIDAFAPTSHMNALPGNSTNPVALSWGGVDDTHGCGVWYYTLYASTDGINFNILKSNITRTDTTFTGAPNTTYYFFVLATDSVGNTEMLRPGEVRSTFIGGTPLPITWLYFRGANQDKNNLLEWATATEQNSKEFKVERSLDGSIFGAIGTVVAAGNSSTTKNYTYTDFGIDKLNSPVMYYRLKQFDISGNFKYSNVVRLNYNQKDIVNSLVYPNPTQGLITITVGDKNLVGTNAILVDENGRILESIKITANSQSINMSKYVNGVYFIRLNNKEVLKIVKM